MGETRKKLVIIDGKSVFYRGYYAMPFLSTKDGISTGGVFGFATMALEVIKKLSPDYVCVAWDKPKTNIRKRLKMYPEYKAGRKPAPPDFYDQIHLLHDLLEAFGWPLYELDDYEADDIMGALAVQAKKKNIETMLITSDLDMLQLVNPLTHVYALKKGFSNIELFHPESLTEKYQIQPNQFLDLKALKGDSSDNIPGVIGIGEKTAIKLLLQFKDLDNIYKNLDLIDEKTRKKLEAGKSMAYLSKELAKIWIDAPIKLNLKQMDGSKKNPEKIQELLIKFEFKSLVKQLPEIMHTPNLKAIANGGLFLGENIIIDKNEDLQIVKLVSSKPTFIFSRNAGKNGAKPTIFVISQEPSKVYTIELKNISIKQFTAVFSNILSSNSSKLIGYDIKSTIKVLFNLGIQITQISHDVLIGAFLLDSLLRDQSLTDLASQINYHGSSFENLTDEEIKIRAHEIIAVIRALYEQQINEFEKLPKIKKLASDIEWPIIPVLAKMEYIGIGLDVKYLNKFSTELGDDISDTQQKIFGFADQEFNINSPQQLSEILYTKLNLPTQFVKKGKNGYSTAANELDKLRYLHPIIDLISKYRELTKLKTTYVDTLPVMVDDNSKIHTSFNLTVAQTGRLSSSDPNLQNIPVRTELGKRIRTAFIADKGNVFVSADYSQFELRLAAYLANDMELIDMFNRDIDIHNATAAQIYGREPEDVTKNMRRDAKVVNFGILYGMSPHGLSIATDMNVAQAKEFIDKYFELRKPILDYLYGLKDFAAKNGYVETIFGRRRPMPDIHASNFVVRQAAERAAMNMPIQGTAADLTKMAMIEIDKKLDKDCKILLQIHDSILVECPEEKANSVSSQIKSIMENIYKLPIKLTVETESGKNWGEI